MKERERVDPNTARERRVTTGGRSFWRTLEDLVEEKDIEAIPQLEASRYASVLRDTVDRRSFLKLVAASLAFAGLTGCTPRPPEERIVPYVEEPESIVPGESLFFATTMTVGRSALGLLVESREGRPIKVEGNPQHPASLGATDAFAQAAILELYDPDRSQQILREGKVTTWETFIQEFQVIRERFRGNGGAGLRLLTESVVSPTLADQLARLLDTFPEARWYQYESIPQGNALQGAAVAFGEPLDPVYRFSEAEVILSLDADFLTCRPGTVRYAHDFAGRRRVRSGQSAMNRLYTIESTPGNTGAMADHRFPARAGQIGSIAISLARALGLDLPAPETDPVETIPWFRALVRDLEANRGASLVLVGDGQPPEVHALVHAINDRLGNTGRTVVYIPPVIANPRNEQGALRELVGEMDAGEVDTLLILGGNPVYTAPADIPFARLLPHVNQSIHLSLYPDETSVLCRWHLPEQHFLESWSDARTFDGTASIVQPLIAPFYDTRRSAHELVELFLSGEARSGYEIVRAYWAEQSNEAGFERFWRRALHDGVIVGSAFTPRSPSITADLNDLADIAATTIDRDDALELLFRPDPSIWDGRFANNGWLQELPKPLTKLTWDNAALISPATAERLALSNEDLVELRYRERVVRAPIWVMPGHADGSVTVYLGYGRRRAGRVGEDLGFDAYSLRTSEAPWFDQGVSIVKQGARYTLATTQHHHRMEERDLVRVLTVEQFRAQAEVVPERPGTPTPLPSFYPEAEYEGYAWGMAIDLSACTGCNACVIACQAENNIPTVGKQEVERGREMHWIRVDRYYAGDLDNPHSYFQPVLCMHCEKAPCEWVCPVKATVHSEEGLNEMIYSRCVGTRYCSNNCPYKVRRFNFFDYVERDIPVLDEMRNPDVTVRSRGVMEKCTYCVQRINRARIETKQNNRRIEDGEVVPACAQACPTRAIVFGDINDPESEVSQLKAQPHNYGLLAHLNTQPRTTYLSRIHNPNPEIERG